MRKGQLRLLEQATKRNMSTEKIAILQDETYSLAQLRALYYGFAYLPDFPIDYIVDQVINQYNLDVSNDWHLNYRTPLSYADFLALPQQLQNDPDLARSLYKHYERILPQENLTFIDFCSWYKTVCGDYISVSWPSDFFNLLDYYDDTWPRRTKYDPRYSLDYYAYLLRLAITTQTIAQGVMKHELEQLRTKFEADGPSYYVPLSYSALLTQQYGTFRFVKHCYRDAVPVEDVFKMAIHQLPCKLSDTQARVNDAIQHLKAVSQRPIYSTPTKTVHVPIENIKFIYEYDEQEQAVNALQNLDNVTAQIKAKWVKSVITTSDSSSRIQIDFSEGSYISINNKKIEPSYQHVRSGSTYTLTINYEGYIFIKHYNSERPASCKEVFWCCEHFCRPDILNIIYSLYDTEQVRMLKDLYADYQSSCQHNVVMPPVIWNHALTAHNRFELMTDMYANAEDINWNKLGVCRGYAIVRTRPYVDDKSKTILYNAVTNGQIPGVPKRYCCNCRGKNAAIAVVTEFLLNKFKPADICEADFEELCNTDAHYRDLYREIHDYTRNIPAAGIKLNMKLSSIKKIIEKNTEVILARQEKYTPVVKIPADSKFNALAEVLPQDFERIAQRRRLILEGHLMHHCVASYAHKINKDDCAIYHLEYVNPDGSKTPYTIEFVVSGDHYVTRQLQSRCDRGAPDEVWKYVNSFVNGVKYVPKTQKIKRKNHNNLHIVA